MSHSKHWAPDWCKKTEEEGPLMVRLTPYNRGKKTEDSKGHQKMKLYDLTSIGFQHTYPKEKLSETHDHENLWSHEMNHALFQDLQMTSYLSDTCSYCMFLKRVRQFAGHDSEEFISAFNRFHDIVRTRLQGKHCPCKKCKSSWGEYQAEVMQFVDTNPNINVWNVYTKWPGLVNGGVKPEQPLPKFVEHEKFKAYLSPNFQMTPDPLHSLPLLDTTQTHCLYTECWEANRRWRIPVTDYTKPITMENTKYPQLSDPDKEDVFHPDYYYICREGWMHTLMQCYLCDVVMIGEHGHLYYCKECHGSRMQFFKLTHKGQDKILNDFLKAVGVTQPAFRHLIIGNQVVEVWITDLNNDLSWFNRRIQSLFLKKDAFNALTLSHISLHPRYQDVVTDKEGKSSLQVNLDFGDIPIVNRHPFNEFRKHQEIFNEFKQCNDLKLWKKHPNYDYNSDADCTDDHFRDTSEEQNPPNSPICPGHPVSLPKSLVPDIPHITVTYPEVTSTDSTESTVEADSTMTSIPEMPDTTKQALHAMIKSILDCQAQIQDSDSEAADAAENEAEVMETLK